VIVVAASSRAGTVSALVFAFSFGALLGSRVYSGAGDTLPAELLPAALLRNGGPDYRGLVVPDREHYGFRDVDGRIVSVYPIVGGLLHVPVAGAAALLGHDVVERRIGLARRSAAWIAAAATAFLFLALDAYVRRRTALLFSAVFLLGTEVFSVAGRGLWQHGPALLFINLALALLVRPRLVAWSGFPLALAVCARPTVALLAVAVTGWVALRRRDALGTFLVGAALPATALTIYSAGWLGSPFAMGQLLDQSSFGRFSIEALLGLVASPSRGLFVYSPVFLLALVPSQRWAGAEPHAGLVGALTLFVPSLLVFTAFWPNWWGGHSFGYRILSELIPVLLFRAALAWERPPFRATVFRTAGALLIGLSIAAHALGAFTPSRFNVLPDDIDTHPARLWDVRDSDLARILRGRV
jgi:hypothetical protein